MRTLVTGGVRSGKSAHAEGALPGGSAVTYVATGPVLDDADWADRVTAHRERRPGHWRTVETTDVASTLRRLDGPALVDCLGTWLTARLDALGAWDDSAEAPREWEARLRDDIGDLAAAVREFPHDLVVVTNEVGLGLVSEHRSGRIFADHLGWLNQAVAASCDRVVLVVSGQALVVKDACG